MMSARVRDGHLVSALALLILLPSLLFTSYLALVPGLAVICGVVGAGLLIVWRQTPADGSLLARPMSWGRLALCAAVAVLLLVLGGEGHLFFANWDWLWRDAVLADLTRSSALPLYKVDGSVYLLRAPLGMYLVPALFGRFGTLGLAHAALVAQNAALLAGLLYLIVTLGARHGYIVLLVFVAFSGLDIVGTIATGLENGHTLGTIEIPSMIDYWPRVLQYSSAVTLLFWVPNHCLPGWWLAILSLLCARREIGLGELGIGLAACLLWSPLAVVGTLPIAAVLFAGRLHCLREGRFWASAIVSLGFLPIAIYLISDAAAVPHDLPILEPGYWMLVVLFLIIEIPHVFVLYVTWRRLPSAYLPILAASVLVLIGLPLVKFGSNNDLLMRGSIPALAILAVAFGEIVAQGWRPQPIVFAGTLAIAALGAVTPAFEVVRALHFSRFAVSTCNLVTVWKSQLPDTWLANYLASPKMMPAYLMAPVEGQVLERETRACWPDMPFDMHLAVFLHSNSQLEQITKAHRQDTPN